VRPPSILTSGWEYLRALTIQVEIACYCESLHLWAAFRELGMWVKCGFVGFVAYMQLKKVAYFV